MESAHLNGWKHCLRLIAERGGVKLQNAAAKGVSWEVSRETTMETKRQQQGRPVESLCSAQVQVDDQSTLPSSYRSFVALRWV